MASPHQGSGEDQVGQSWPLPSHSTMPETFFKFHQRAVFLYRSMQFAVVFLSELAKGTNTTLVNSFACLQVYQLVDWKLEPTIAVTPQYNIFPLRVFNLLIENIHRIASFECTSGLIWAKQIRFVNTWFRNQCFCYCFQCSSQNLSLSEIAHNISQRQKHFLPVFLTFITCALSDTMLHVPENINQFCWIFCTSARVNGFCSDSASNRRKFINQVCCADPLFKSLPCSVTPAQRFSWSSAVRLSRPRNLCVKEIRLCFALCDLI